MKHIEPSIELTAFNCPHCGVLTTQYWHDSHAKQRHKNTVPVHIDSANYNNFIASLTENREQMTAWADSMRSGSPFLEVLSYSSADLHVWNLNLSKCFHCKKLTIWVHGEIIYPILGDAPQPNPDMSDDIRRDYNEASKIASTSPRAAAALLRLCIQKLCIELGEKGKRIDDDIGSLVAKGLDTKIQKALDIVRVIGNQSVHPGTIDVGDDHSSVHMLFKLVNLIIEKLISEPKHIDSLFSGLPESYRNAISKRDKT